jgi:hypothetical protein
MCSSQYHRCTCCVPHSITGARVVFLTVSQVHVLRLTVTTVMANMKNIKRTVRVYSCSYKLEVSNVDQGIFLFVLFVSQPEDGHLFSRNMKMHLNSICKNKVVFRENMHIYIYIYIYTHTHTYTLLVLKAVLPPATAVHFYRTYATTSQDHLHYSQ